METDLYPYTHMKTLRFASKHIIEWGLYANCEFVQNRLIRLCNMGARLPHPPLYASIFSSDDMGASAQPKHLCAFSKLQPITGR